MARVSGKTPGEPLSPQKTIETFYTNKPRGVFAEFYGSGSASHRERNGTVRGCSKWLACFVKVNREG
jgi:hypothetical protein